MYWLCVIVCTVSNQEGGNKGLTGISKHDTLLCSHLLGHSTTKEVLVQKKQISRKTWRTIWWAIGLCYLVFFGLLAYVSATQTDVTLTEADVQAMLEQNGDLTTQKGTVVSDIVVDFSKEFVVAFSARGEKLWQPFLVRVTMAGEIECIDGTFYPWADQVNIDHLEVRGVPFDMTEGNKTIDLSEPAVAKVQAHAEANKPKGLAERAKAILGKGTQRAVEAVGGQYLEDVKHIIRAEVIHAIQNTPLDVRDEEIASSALRIGIDSVEVGNGLLTLRVSFWSFGAKAFIVLTFILGLMVISIAYPKFFEAIAETAEVVEAIADLGGMLGG